jgi:hypothetical protein
MAGKGSSNEARIWAVIGASGTGKGLWIKEQLAALQPARLVIWDFMDEYGEHARPSATLDAIRRDMIKAGKSGPLRVRYTPRGTGEKALRKEFETLCELVYAWGGCVFVAEELSNVTTPGWAPPAWRKMSTSGRHVGVTLIGVTQNPALIDKTYLSNCTLVHVSGLRNNAHREYVAREIDCTVEQITALEPFQWIERDHAARELRTGVVKVPNSAPRGRGPSAKATGAAKALRR